MSLQSTSWSNIAPTINTTCYLTDPALGITFLNTLSRVCVVITH